MSQRYLSLYYSLLLFVVISSARNYFYIDPQALHFIGFAYPFEFFVNKMAVLSILFLLTFGVLCCCIFYPNAYFRVSASLLVLIIISAKYSFGKINHADHVWMISSIFMCFLNPQKALTDRMQFFLIRTVQSLMLSHYLISGLWKIRNMTGTFTDMGMEQIASALSEGKVPHPLIATVMASHPWMIGWGWFGVVAFELSALVPILLGRWFPIWGLFVLVFHVTSGVVLDIWFSHTCLAALFFLVFTEIEISALVKSART